MRRLFVLLVCGWWSLLAHAGLFGPDFEITKTVPPKDGEDSVLYLTSNGFTDDEKYYVFGRRFEPRSAGNTKNGGLGSRHHLMRRNMLSGDEVEIAYDPQMSFLGGGGVVSGNTLLYTTLGKEPSIHAVDIPSGESKTIWTLPKNERYGKWTIYPLSAELSGTRVLVSMSDSPPRGTSAKLNDWQDAFKQTDAHSYLYLGILKDGEWTFTQVFEQTTPKDGFLSHAQLNPVTGEDALIELDGIRKNNRAFIINFKTHEMKAVRAEGGNGYMTHCNYIGDQLVQYMFYRGGPTDVGLADVKYGTFKEWEAGDHHHFASHMAGDGTFYVVGDGHSGRWDSVIRYTIRNQKMIDSTRIASRGANTAWEEYHGHPRFSPSGKWLVYTSSDRMEQGQVVIVKDPLKEK